MAEPLRKPTPEPNIQPDIRPKFQVIQGGGNATSERADLRAVEVSNLNEAEAKGNKNDNAADIKEQEQDSAHSPWSYKEDQDKTGTDRKKGVFGSLRSLLLGGKKGKGKASLKGRRKGPISFIVILVLGGGFVTSVLLAPGLLIVNMKESLVKRFNTQLTGMDLRTNAITSKRLNKTTTGIFNNRYSTMSTKRAARLKAAGIEVIGIETKTGRIKPKAFDFNGKKISAAEFYREFYSDSNFRSAMKKAYNPKFVGFADNIWTKIKAKIGLSEKRILPDGDDKAKNKVLDEEAAGDVNNRKPDLEDKYYDTDENGNISEISADDANADDKTLRSAGEEAIEEASGSAQKEASGAIGEAADEVATKGLIGGLAALRESPADFIRGAIRGVNLTPDALEIPCQVYSAVRGLGYAAKTVRALQLARYAMVFLNTADQIKAGTATPEDVSYLGTILTSIAYDATSGIKRKAAMDSAGMKYAMYGDISGFTKKDDKSLSGSYLSQFMAGGGLAGDLIAVNNYIDNAFKSLGLNPRAACQIVLNQWVQLVSAVGGIALLFTPGVGQGLAVLKAALTTSGVLSVVGQAAASFGIYLLPSLLKDIVAGTVAKDLVGEDTGNAIASGAGTIMSQLAQAGGNAPMKVDDAIAFTNTQNEVLAQYAEEERLALSPFDVSSQYTFLGSIAYKLLPYTPRDASLSGSFSSIGSIISSAFASIIPKTQAATDAELRATYTTCNDPDYQEMGIATDPFCNVIFGIPPQFLNKDPEIVASELAGQYDPETGEPAVGSEYEKYVNDCINRTEPLGSGGEEDQVDTGEKCIIKSSNANYYLFYTDLRIINSMDEL